MVQPKINTQIEINIQPQQSRQNRPADQVSQVSSVPAEMLLAYLEAVLAAARPHLLRMARRHGVSTDAADDVVQETLVEAWRHADRLHTLQGIDAWLNSICRHVCLRWARKQYISAVRQTSLFAAVPEGQESEPWLERESEIPDPLAFDPAEELSRQDLTVLLDRALHLLPKSTRKAVELCYLAELPQREVAVRLGLTSNALEVRLHRARQQLRQVLSGELRADAEAFGLTLDQEASVGWRETQQWCHLCGQRRLRGLFDPQTDGRMHLRLRCPDCSPHSCDMFASSQVSGAGFYSFQSAYKHAWKADFAYWRLGIAQGLASRYVCTARNGSFPSKLCVPMNCLSLRTTLTTTEPSWTAQPVASLVPALLLIS